MPATNTHPIRPPDIFPLLFFSPAVSTYTILVSIVIYPLTSLSLLFSSKAHNLPLSSDIFSHPPHTRQPTKRHQSHHPISISDLPIPAYLTPNLASSPLPHLTLPHLTSPVMASILFRLPRTHPCASTRLPRVLLVRRAGQSALDSAFQWHLSRRTS